MNEQQAKWAAQLCHEVNKALCEAFGDYSQKPWTEAERWQRDAALASVQAPNADPAASHQEWMDKKMRDGWTYGPAKDGEKKTHPSLVPYEQLPSSEKAKDFLIGAIVRTMREIFASQNEG